jgi:WD40 repeat protein/formylglycine-generating enzyme required for sulfatase activity
MAWPRQTDYNEAIQSPRLCFKDPDLRQGQPDTDRLGLPRPCTGNFADVYKVHSPGQHAWAVKCFTREVTDLQARYRAISDHLRQARGRQQDCLPFLVDFDYLEEGIRVAGRWYPVLKMRWVQGATLNEFVKASLAEPSTLIALAELWLSLARDLRQNEVAHGDLQHGNVLLVPDGKPRAVRPTLVDYDGMFVPALVSNRPGELGHCNYQHPRRGEDPFHAEVDRFAHLVIYTSLRCLAVLGADLWQRYDNGDNVLFREQDFKAPGESELLRDLWQLDDRPARALVGQLVLASQASPRQVPLLDELVSSGKAAALSRAQEKQVEGLLGPHRGAALSWWQAPARPVGPALPARMTNSIGMQFVLIPAGRFQMGSAAGEGAADERPQHEVEITRPFYLGIYPVTQAQYQAVMGSNPSRFCATGPGKDRVEGRSTNDFPVECVNWDDAQLFLRKLQALEKERAAGRHYRLPTEGEWEYACRGGAKTATAFSFGNSLSSAQANFDSTGMVGADSSTCKVGSYPANGFGLHDMHGNVREWCADLYDEGYYRKSPRCDPQGPARGSDRVTRGGSWDFGAYYCRSAHRSTAHPSTRFSRLGIRVALVAIDPGRGSVQSATPSVQAAATPQATQPPPASSGQTVPPASSAPAQPASASTLPAQTGPPHSTSHAPATSRQGGLPSWIATSPPPQPSPAPLRAPGRGRWSRSLRGLRVGIALLGILCLCGMLVWMAWPEQKALTLKGHATWVRGVAYCPEGTRIVSCSSDSTLIVWEALAGRPALRLTGHTGRVLGVAYRPDGRRIVSAGGDHTLKVWAAATGRRLVSLEGHTGWVSSVAYSPDGSRIASGSEDRTVKVWEPARGRILLSLEGHTGWVSSVAYSPDGQRIASGSWDNTAKVWDARTGQDLLTLKGHSDFVLSVAYSPDGQRIVSGSHDRTLKVWDARTGHALLTLTGHTGPVLSVAYSPDGQRIVSGSEDDTLKVWDAQTGRNLLTLTGHTGPVSGVAYSPDGKHVVSGSHDHTLKVWDIDLLLRK